ncbi:YwaF family protein [Neobacillus kokaensis]|uniref:ABC transporter permease n=1 Tax=Neobacillus kokaensis TaxID=2759023 RepID=A0ABQ3MW55_9BACI|nr:TIGR02206 family membrane protein [Neobacillus kokaensis]GHH96662.1 ABC transporter permease [Neobacillus kokaensis]
MEWFGGSNKNYQFEMFSDSHFAILALLLIVSIGIFLLKKKLGAINLQAAEIGLSASLIMLEITYHLWMISTSTWNSSHSIPLELCNISFFLTILLLITKKKLFYEILLFTGLLGASQALVTPLLSYDFPHFRFFHFFCTHLMMIWVPLYFTWVKGYRPTIWSVVKLLVFLNVLMPVVMFINKLVAGNYMFLSQKPNSSSLLDFLGPYPLYIISMEGLLIVLSLIVWLAFREKTELQEKAPKYFAN